MTSRLIYVIFLVSLLSISQAHGQKDSLSFKEDIGTAARPYQDSILLRWAPLKTSHWQLANKNGYKIERYVVARNGKVLGQPEKVDLTPIPLKPFSEDQWEAIVRRDKYHAIAAQALFGDRFEVDLSKSDIFTIVNKVRENDQRFAFALFCADMSPRVAKASGLWFTDKKIVKGEKYLYRIIVNGAEHLRGSIFIGADDDYELTKPRNLIAKFEGSVVSLQWDKNVSEKYTAYMVERSVDGKIFQAISDIPLMSLSPTDQADNRYEYAIDSIPDISQTYYYRVRGITPFAEMSIPSDISSGKGTRLITDVPYIRNGENVENKLIRITWDFAKKDNAAIKGFMVERSLKAKGNFIQLTAQTPIPPSGRSFDDKSPNQVNYYRVTALGLDGRKYSSPVYLAQLIDSIPPGIPIGLKATIDENGVAEISWQQNKDEDIYGYRVYKSNTRTEEQSQVTSRPIPQARFIDTVNLNTLNKEVYYSVMAIDRNQNHSGLSEIIRVPLPDKIKPQPPVFLPVKGDETGVLLTWIRSSSDDVVRYIVYRKADDQAGWQQLNMVQASADTAMRYKDESVSTGGIHTYTVVAVDHSGLESDPASPVNAGKVDNKLQPNVRWKAARIAQDQNRVLLKWDYTQENISSFRIYKGIGEEPLVMYRTVGGDKREYIDEIPQTGKEYKYRIMAVFKNGAKSELSEMLKVSF